MGESYELVPETDEDGNARTVPERRAIARDWTIAIAYIRGAGTSRYGTLIKELGNRYARRKDEYPSDLNDAYSALVDYSTPTNTGGSRGWSGGAGSERRYGREHICDRHMLPMQLRGTLCGQVPG